MALHRGVAGQRDHRRQRRVRPAWSDWSAWSGRLPRGGHDGPLDHLRAAHVADHLGGVGVGLRLVGGLLRLRRGGFRLRQGGLGTARPRRFRRGTLPRSPGPGIGLPGRDRLLGGPRRGNRRLVLVRGRLVGACRGWPRLIGRVRGPVRIHRGLVRGPTRGRGGWLCRARRCARRIRVLRRVRRDLVRDPPPGRACGGRLSRTCHRPNRVRR
ncbi:hypothetical protein UO65_4712 [Actinokineospora spheciospongiae]|uniref:Uncharacterized protein n=1 Tax=Actinokineospora spheciospongiae TaxID=909613 RepID=W7II08_9PSEU|nr:hypothetical protein UO65_4712 [Actinokineospora spheciospongiae]